ncbi:MAG: DNA polymerase Y family protein [Paracoccaceae bacterium]
MTRRMLSIWLPEMAIERWLRTRRGERLHRPDTDRPVPPAVLTETGARGILITAASTPAQKLGIGPGMRLTDARTICPALGAVPHDRAADAALLGMMADAMLRFTPWVALDGADGLMLDVTGCAHLKGGEEALADAIRVVFDHAGFTAHIGLADTQGAAWALARYGADQSSITTGDPIPALTTLPMAALRLSPETMDGLARLGLKRIGDLTGLDRSSLMRRFPPNRKDPGPVARLDQALGRRDEPLTPRAEAPDYRVHVSPMEPLIDIAGIRHHFDDLLASLMGILASNGHGAQRLSLHAFRCDGPVIRLGIGLARASREVGHITRLFVEKLGEIDPGFGVDTLMLSADVTESVTAQQQTLEPAHETASEAAEPDALERLVDRISNRLGVDSIYRLEPVASHIPDRSVRRADPVRASAHASAREPEPERPANWSESLAPIRPLTLLERPEPIAVMAEIPEGPPVTFRWRRVLHQVTCATGPERIAPEWWRDLANRNRTRDYYAIEDADGGRYWLFRDGLYHQPHARGAPEWFLHGIFA